MDNALKYGAEPQPGHEAFLGIEARRVNTRIEIRVLDHGPGIPEDQRQAVRERFVRLDRSRSKPGLGLGLSLVQAIAHLHGGSLHLDDNQPGLIAALDLPALPMPMESTRPER